MTLYPDALDDDSSIIRVDDNLSELGVEAISQLREAAFAIEAELGTNPAGSAGSVAERLDVAHNADGTLKDTALNAVGVASFPIDNLQVDNNAGIEESKLALDYSTASLKAQADANTNQLTVTNGVVSVLNSNFASHLVGAETLLGGSSGRHTLNQVDPNVQFLNADGYARPNDDAQGLLYDINQSLINHQLTTSVGHPATAITVDTSNFDELPQSITNAQEAFDAIDNFEAFNLGEHRATQHCAGIPRISRSNLLNQFDTPYSFPVVPETPVKTYLKHNPFATPVDDVSIGDDLVRFYPTNIPTFDGYFSQVVPGDVITITYDNGIATTHLVNSLRYLPRNEYLVRINGTNLFDADGYQDGYVTARIDRPRYDRNTAGVLAVAPANPTPTGSFSNLMGSVIVGNPRGATALGLGFDASQLDGSHFRLHLELYPTGNPLDHVISLPGIDVTGNNGVTPGDYTLSSVVQAANNSFREIGYNYRFLAFEHEGNFGVMLTDCIDGASFAIVSGDASSGTLVTGIYAANVLGGSSVDGYDALGFGPAKANLASPAFRPSYVDETDAQLPTKIIGPARGRYAYVNGQKRDTFATTYLAEGDGYWTATIISKTQIGLFTVETTYEIEADLAPSGVRPGMTLTAAPLVSFDSASYSDYDYGRFIIKSVNFIAACDPDPAKTQITVINGAHASGDPITYFPDVDLHVRVYFGYDSVTFNSDNVIDQSPSLINYRRFHEIYFDVEGKTFSHERGRLPQQTETATLLGTTNWRIVDISPKLRGYTDDNVSFNRYLRLAIISYDSTSGEFDGYLGQRDPLSTNVLRGGPIATGRKDVTVRFYDETGIDYVELVYLETVSPGQPILSTASARYVDLEIFPSLQEHDELLLLATCQVNWDPDTGQDLVEQLQNRRAFGSVCSKDLTPEAKTFLSTGDRFLHRNGVISGFELGGITDRRISLQGGVAVVNGYFVSANVKEVELPQCWRFGTGFPQTVTWCLCVNSVGELIPVIITNSRLQFFATIDAVNSYYLPSYTFFELIHSQRELTPLWFFEVTFTAAGVYNSLVSFDVRQFIIEETTELPLTVSGGGILGGFRDFDVLINWLQRYQAEANGKFVVQVKGEFNLTNSIDLAGFTSEVKFLGNGARITVTGTNPGFVLGNNVHFENIEFVHSITGGSLTDYVNSDGGLIYGADSLSNVKIENCKFIENLGTLTRYPFISIETSNGEILENIIIRNNVFEDDEDTERFAAISIINLNDAVGSTPAIGNNIIVENNICNRLQGIYLTSKAVAGIIDDPGFSVSNSRIANNSCGVIGYHLSGKRFSLDLVNSESSLIIENNTCRYIGALSGEGLHILSSTQNFAFDYPTGTYLIRGNACAWIDAVLHSTSAIRSSVNLYDNVLRAWDSTFRDAIVPDGYGSELRAIQVIDNKTAADYSGATIVNNRVDYGYDENSVTYSYEGILRTEPSSIVTGNIFRGTVDEALLANRDYFIVVDQRNGQTRRITLKNNHLYRENARISQWLAEDINAIGNFVILAEGNTLDSTTIDGSTLSNLNTILTNGVYSKNINSTHSGYVYAPSGMITLNFYDSGNASSSDILRRYTAIPGNAAIEFQYNNTGVNETLRWVIPVWEVIPEGAKILSASITAQATVNPSTSGNIQIEIGTGGLYLDSGSISTVSNTVTADASAGDIRSYAGAVNMIIVSAQFQSGSASTISLTNISISWRW